MPPNRSPRVMKCYSPTVRRNRGGPLKRLLGYVRPERVNKWPNSMKDIWWWWWWWWYIAKHNSISDFIKVYFLRCFVQRHVWVLVMSHLKADYFSYLWMQPRLAFITFRWDTPVVLYRIIDIDMSRNMSISIIRYNTTGVSSAILEFHSCLLDSRQTDGRLERWIWIGASQRYEHA